MKKSPLLPILALALTALPILSFAAGPIELAGTHGKFDFIKIDSPQRRLLACHTGNGSLDVIDLDASKLIKAISTGAAQGVAIDEKNGRYFVSVSQPPKLVIIDAKKLEILGSVALPDPADLVAYHPGTNRVFVCNDEKPELWVIDPQAMKITQTITFPGGGMEDLVFDESGHFLLQALKDSSQIARLDVAQGKIAATWSSAPSTKPHGLALVPEKNSLLIAGDGHLSLLDLDKGTVAASSTIAQRVDEIAYDPALKVAYGASGTGTISTVRLQDGKLLAGESLPGAQGAHSIAVDLKTHALWIAFGNDHQSFVQKIEVASPPSS